MILVTGGKKFVAILFLVFLGTVFVFKVLKSKNARKQTGFKIQFYIGIHLTGIDFGCFGDLTAMSLWLTVGVK